MLRLSHRHFEILTPHETEIVEFPPVSQKSNIVLGEHGYVGFVLYFALALAVLILCQKVVGRSKGIEDLSWANDLARLTQISCILFFVTGAAANFAYFELYITFLGIAVALRTIIKKADVDSTVAMGMAHEDFNRHVETKPSTFRDLNAS